MFWESGNIKMEDYNRIYPEVPKEDKIYPEALKDGNAFRLQQSCRVLENLEKEAKHYASVRKKYKRCYNVLSRISTSTGTLSFCLSGSGVGTAFSGVGLPLAESLGGLGFVCGVVSVIAGEAGKKVSRKVTKHEKTVSVCLSKINSLKDRISKALADDRISVEEFEYILAEMKKYHEMTKDIRRKVKKTADAGEVSQLRREIRADILKKTSIRRRPAEIKESYFCFLRSWSDSEAGVAAGGASDSGVEEQRPPPYNPDFLTFKRFSRAQNFVPASF